MKIRPAGLCRLALIALLVFSCVHVSQAQVVARWAQQSGKVVQNGIHTVSGGADGAITPTTRGGSPCVETLQDTDPKSGGIYVYFTLDDAVAVAKHRPLYVTVSYYDEKFDDNISLEYDSDQGSGIPEYYTVADQQLGGARFGRGRWEVAGFELDHPSFQHRQNNGADFRIDGRSLYLRAASVSLTKPAVWSEIASDSHADIPRASTVRSGNEFILGGWDVYSPKYAAAALNGFRTGDGIFRFVGATSHETYVRWNVCEPKQGQFDWSTFDGFVKEYKRIGIKWVPLLIAGPAHSLPNWYYRKPGSQGYVCLEHHEQTDIQSLWNPTFRRHIAQFYKAFFDHYRQSGVIESVMLGISGNYGEAIYPASGLAPNDWTTLLHGTYHTHLGYWCGDPYAVADFQRWVKAKYPTVTALRKAWKEPALTSYAAVQPFLQANAPDDRAWIDMLDWYSGSMTKYATYCLQQARQDFPNGEIYLCSGGDGSPQHGSNFAAQCKAAASVHAGVRITNEDSDYGFDFTQTRWVASAARQYGTFVSFEPGGNIVGTAGDTVRLYNSASSGVRGFFDYQGNVPSSADRIANFKAQSRFLRQRQPVNEIDVYYPETWVQLHGDVTQTLGNIYLKDMYSLRDRFDFGFMGDTQIADGGLAHIKALVLLDGNIAEGHCWQSIENWVRHGGILIYPNSLGALKTVEGDSAPLNALFHPNASTSTGHVFVFNGEASSSAYRDFVTRSLKNAPGLSVATQNMLHADGVEDSVYISAIDPHDLLWLNEGDQAVTRQIGSRSIQLPPGKIVQQSF